jgi:protein-S-isoprenylcysteine O-methyltransferase Ste14
MAGGNLERDSPGVIIFPPILFGLGMIVSTALHFVSPQPIVARGLAFVLSGLILALSISLAIWAHRTMSAAGTTPNPAAPTTALVTTGPFAYSRNPIYIAETLIYVAVAFFVNDLWFAPVLVAVMVVLERGVIRREERYLAAKFAGAYEHYRAHVRRWL